MILDKAKRAVALLLHNLSGYRVYVSVLVCDECGKILEIKDGKGKYGLSWAICPACEEKAREAIG